MEMNASSMGVLIIGALMLVGVGVVVAIGANVTSGITSTLVTGETVTNETIVISAMTNNTAISLATTSQPTSVVQISNQTTIIPSQFYTFAGGLNGGTVTPVLPSNYSFTSDEWDITYNQNSPTIASAASGNATSGLGQLASQLPNVGLVIGAAAILAIVFGVLFKTFGGVGRRE